MANEVTSSLFGITPDAYQQARDAQLQEQALKYAQLDPFQRAAMGTYVGASRLGSAVGGMLGGTDPELERVKARQMAVKSADLSNAAGYKQLASSLLSAGDYMGAQEAMAKATAMEKAALDAAQAKAQADKAATESEMLARAQRGRASRLMKLDPTLSEQDALDIASDDETYKAVTANPELKTEVVEVNGRKLLINKANGETVSDLGPVTKKSSLGEDIASGLAPLAAALAAKQGAESMGGAGGKGVGEAAVTIQGKYDAIDAVDTALNLLDKGIYSGGYGPLQEAATKYSMGVVGDKARLANTEVFRAEIGNVVIPRLQEFGGNDSVEELKYLRSVMAGDTTAEPETLRRVLESANRKIRRGIERIKQQQESIMGGKPLPLDNTVRKATKRWNKATQSFEEVK